MFYKKYTDGTHQVIARPLTNHNFLRFHEQCSEEHLIGIEKKNGYIVKYDDDKITITSWYPKQLFEQKFKLDEPNCIYCGAEFHRYLDYSPVCKQCYDYHYDDNEYDDNE